MRFEKLFGPPGDPPAGYWQPWLADWFSLRPRDLGELTPAQLMSCYEHATRKPDNDE